MESKNVLKLICVLMLCGIGVFNSYSQNTADTPQKKAAPANEESRKFIYGCGIMMGAWYEMKPAEAEKWNIKCMDMIKDAGATCIGGNLAWIDIETTRGICRWEANDRFVEEARKRGLEIFAYTGLTPDWALPHEAPKDKPGIGYRFPPDPKYTKDFENFFTTLAARYKGKIKYYEFWNEPNGCGWINEGCANGNMAKTYSPWLKLWYNAMKKGDPDCVLAVGGLDYNEGIKDAWKFLEDIYSDGGKDYFDAVAIHPYGYPLNWQAVKDTYAVMQKHGDGHKKLWLNEYGWDYSDERMKSENIKTVLTELAKPEYSMVFQASYLVLTDLKPGKHDYGLCDIDLKTQTITPRESYETFREFKKK